MDKCFCDALKAGPEEIVLELDDCNQITIPGERLKSNRTQTRFTARSVRGESPGYVLSIDCRRGRLSLRLKNTNLKNCVPNPVITCVSITDGPCICAEKDFKEMRDKKGRLKKLLLKVTGSCAP